MSRFLLFSLFVMVYASESLGAAHTTWPFDLETTGGDVVWTSDTAVDPNAARYRFEYTITLAEADGTVGGFPAGTFDVLESLTPEQLVNVGYALGPAPVVVWSSSIVAPEPPAAPAASADIQITVDAGGFANMSMTNVALGTTMVDIGPPFGVVPLTVTRIRMAGTIRADIFALSADLNGDCLVDTADLGLLIGGFGTIDEQGDINGDGVVDTADLGALIGQFGMSCP